MKIENDQQRINIPIHLARKHYFGIEYDFAKSTWLWNTHEEVDDQFWLQSENGFINYHEPQLQDKLIYTMTEQNATDPAMQSLQKFEMSSTVPCRYNLSLCPQYLYIWNGYTNRIHRIHHNITIHRIHQYYNTCIILSFTFYMRYHMINKYSTDSYGDINSIIEGSMNYKSFVSRNVFICRQMNSYLNV